MIESSIENDNLPALEILWQGAKLFDGKILISEENLYHALEHSKLRTVRHILHAVLFRRGDSQPSMINYDECLQRSVKNQFKSVCEYIKRGEGFYMIKQFGHRGENTHEDIIKDTP